MSDTTITPEERRTWRNEHANWTGRDSDLVVRVRLMDALEAAEKSLLKEEVYSEELESQLQDAESEYNANWAVQAISDVARLVGVYEQCSETGDDIGAAVIEAVQDLKDEKEKTEAENARLRAERVSLTGIANYAPELNMSNYDEDQVSALNDDMINVCRILQKEAARRAVAESEVGE